MLSWHAFDLGLLQDLKSFSIAREEWGSRDELKDDASSSPDVNAAVVLVAAHY